MGCVPSKKSEKLTDPPSNPLSTVTDAIATVGGGVANGTKAAVSKTVDGVKTVASKTAGGAKAVVSTVTDLAGLGESAPPPPPPRPGANSLASRPPVAAPMGPPPRSVKASAANLK